MATKKDSALIIIDVQNDFCPGGSLAVKDGDTVVPVINAISKDFSLVVATQDWHPEGHVSFASSHTGKTTGDTVSLGKEVQLLWPDHCVQGSRGADFHPGLDLRPVRFIVRKGTSLRMDSYSAFFENDKKTSTGLEFLLKGLGIRAVYLSGLATDYCVFYSAMDAVNLGFATYLLIDGCRGVDIPEGNIDAALATMRNRGIAVIRSEDV
ncbi:MAG TPA: bifunctional nicotinamidase/pyrazinamidase [Spirochaetia bacterium]|jgi:nicotinamidase/pyrazinamidase|nr:bifunctional nicotinamidase/pyrazinamidase [Spirochaetia bacterium]